MLISEFISILLKTSDLEFRFQDGKSVPPHFHITEVGLVSKKFVDCGGIFRAIDDPDKPLSEEEKKIIHNNLKKLREVLNK